MASVNELLSYCDELLSAGDFDDYCPNGLQVEGDRPIRRLITGVTACQALIDAALVRDADAILVHHGWFWKGENPCLTGMKGRRVRALVRHGASMLAYHLPLDAHPELGNNRRLADALNIRNPRSTEAGRGLVWFGELDAPIPGEQFARRLSDLCGRAPQHVAVVERPIASIAWCTGAAQGFIDEAAAVGADAYLSGEISEPTTHQARELGLDYFAAGHHATERYGVKALGEHLAERFELDHRFVDIDNPA